MKHYIKWIYSFELFGYIVLSYFGYIVLSYFGYIVLSYFGYIVLSYFGYIVLSYFGYIVLRSRYLYLYTTDKVLESKPYVKHYIKWIYSFEI